MIGRRPAGAPPGPPPEICHDQGTATLGQAPCLGGVDLPPSLSDKYHGTSERGPEGALAPWRGETIKTAKPPKHLKTKPPRAPTRA
jgi:hypothetical protein